MTEFNPQELQYDVGETCSTNEMCIDCCVSTMKQSDWGRMLAKNKPRYEDFWGGKKSRWEDLEEFKRLIGDDVDPVMHGPYQAINVAIPMIESQNSDDSRQSFTREEGKLLILGHIWHDVHEGVSGDVAYPDKTDQTYEDELELNLTAVKDILCLKDCDPFLAEYRGVVGDLQQISFAGRAFTAGEWCGYMMTGLKAWSLRNHLPLNEEQRKAMEIMGREVTLGIVDKVAEYAEEFTLCAELIIKNEVALEEMVKSLP